jgi:DNA-binding CsgD family transcriptional regulator
LWDNSTAAHLDDVAVCVYQYAAVRTRLHPDDVVRHCGLSAAVVDDAIAALVEYRLLEPADSDSGEYAAVAPGTAATQLLGPIERDLRDRQMHVAGVQALLTSLIPLYEEGSLRRRLPGAVEPLADPDTVNRVSTELAANCRTEMLDARPGGANRDDEPADMFARDKEMLHRGVRMYVLYQHGAQFHPPSMEYAEFIMGQGAQVRTVVGGLQRMSIFDREHALIPLRPNASSDTADEPSGSVLVRDPSTVTFIVRDFEASWQAAQPFGDGQRKESLRLLSDRTKRVLLQMLVEGASDQAVARTLGLSVRTCQRHVAEVMRRLSAKNRLQMGYLVHRLGLLDDSSLDETRRPGAANVGTVPAQANDKETML